VVEENEHLAVHCSFQSGEFQHCGQLFASQVAP